MTRIALALVSVACGGVFVIYCTERSSSPIALGPTSSEARASVPEGVKPTVAACDPTLWAHVYHGHFDEPQDRLHILQPCITVLGTVVNAVREKDGDWHVRLDLDEPYQHLLNDFNRSRQNGYLVIELMCANRISQTDTLNERVCDNFSQDLFATWLIGEHVHITGAYVTDVEHGWNEIHPVSSIVVQ